MRKYRILSIVVIVLLVAFFPFGESLPIKYIERSSGEVKIEKVPGEYWLRWLYNNPVGEISLETIVKRKFLSDWYGNKMDSPESADKIASFVEEYNIDLSIAKKKEFTSFNDFFYRELKDGVRPFIMDSNIVCSPADGKLLVYNNIGNKDFIVKGYRLNLNDFLQNDELAEKYKEGTLIIIRLCPTDYHRYHFPLAGEIQKEVSISGDLYSVSPIAIKKKIEIFCMNKRSYLQINNQYIGNYIIAEVGATMVGSIVRTYTGKYVEKGEEMGYFKFGGSTIVLLFERGKLTVDTDLIENTVKGIETEVKVGERIGKI
jgi:phosphatidylserine decarboxylase